MSEYVLKIEDESQARALLTYLRSLDFIELIPKQEETLKRKAIADMQSFLNELPNQSDYTQEEVNQALSEIRKGRNE